MSGTDLPIDAPQGARALGIVRFPLGADDQRATAVLERERLGDLEVAASGTLDHELARFPLSVHDLHAGVILVLVRRAATDGDRPQRGSGRIGKADLVGRLLDPKDAWQEGSATAAPETVTALPAFSIHVRALALARAGAFAAAEA